MASSTAHRPVRRAVRHARLLAGFGAALLAGLVSAQTLDAPAARDALARGAVAWDVRDAPAALVPGALRVDVAAVDAWLQRGDLQALARAVSAAGLNLAGEVLVYGDAGDDRAERIARALRDVSRGRVHRLDGGFAAWQAAGLPTAAQAARRLPLPQRLTVIRDDDAALPADPARRASVPFAAPTVARIAGTTT